MVRRSTQIETQIFAAKKAALISAEIRVHRRTISYSTIA
jgi:hypothetical protein